MLKFKNFSKSFGKIVIADNINFDFEKCTYGFLGKNGTGKTTILRCITGLEPYKKGEIIIDSFEQIGYLPQNFNTFPHLTLKETILFFADLRNINLSYDEISELLDSVGLRDYIDKKVKTLSGGMKRRLGIAISLIGKAEIVLLDEPTAGLDPEERIKFKNLLIEQKSERLILLSTHILSDIEELCDKIIILKDGKLTLFDSVCELAKLAEGKTFAAKKSDKSLKCHKTGIIKIENEIYNKYVSSDIILGAIPVDATAEDGYIAFLENI